MIKTINKCISIILCTVMLLPLCFTIAEAEENSVNVSLGKNVYVSSFYSGYEGLETVLTDGKTDAYCPTGMMYDPRYYIIDLAGYYNINKIELDPRYQYYDFNDTRDTAVYVSDKLLQGVEIETATYIGSAYAGGEPKKITLDTDAYGRYVYIYKPQTTNRSMLCFSEISVYADKNACLGDSGFFVVHDDSVEISFSYDVEESKMNFGNFVVFAGGKQVNYQNYRTEKNKFFLDLCGLAPEKSYNLVISGDVTKNGAPYTVSFKTDKNVAQEVTVGKNGKTHFFNESVTELRVIREGTYNIYQEGQLKGKVSLPCGRYSFSEFVGNIALQRTDFYTTYNVKTAKSVDEIIYYGEEKYASYGEVGSSEITVDFENSGYHLLTVWGRTKKGEATLTPIFDERALDEIIFSDSVIPKSFIVNADSGNHSLKLFSASGNALCEYVEVTYLKGINEEKEKAFLDAIKASDGSYGVRNVFKQFEDDLNLNISNLENGVLHTEPCYASLSGKSFLSLEDIINTIRENMYDARDGISEIVTKDDTNLYVTVPTYGFNEQGALLGALYENGKLISLSAVRYRKQASVKFTFPNTEYSDKLVFKTILMKDLESFVPLDKYENVYKEYFVSTTGNDANSGEKSAPFATVEKALSAVGEINDAMTGDIIINVEKGTYIIPETLLIDNSNCGKNGYDVILRGDESGETLISGGSKITGWVPYKNGIYKASAEGFPVMRNLYVNGLAAERAKSENVFRYDSDIESGFKTKAVSGNWNFAYPNELEVVWNHAFYTRRFLVEKVTQSGNVLNFTMKQPYYDNINNIDIYGGKTFSGNPRFYIENALELLDQEGEFYFDKTNSLVYYYPFAEENLEKAEVFAPKTEGLLKIVGDDKENKAGNVIVENISFKYGAWNKTNETGFATASQSTNSLDLTQETSSSLKIPGQVTLTNCENVILKNLNISSCGSTAVVMDTGVKNAEILGSTITDVSGAAIDVGKSQHDDRYITTDDELCANISINNNVIRRTGIEYFNAPGMAIYYADGVEIDHNDISECSYSGISIGWGWNTSKAKRSGRYVVTNNKISDVMCTLYDGGIIYTLGEMPDTLIEGNYLVKNNDSGYGAVYCDAGSRYITIRENLISDVAWWLFTQSGYDARDIDAYRNYSDNLYFTHNNKPLVNTNVETPTYSVSPYSGEALRIFNEAGVTEKYKDNVSKYESPSWKTSIIKTTPKS